MKKIMRYVLLALTLTGIMAITCPVYAAQKVDFTYGATIADVANPERNYLIVVNNSHPIDLNGEYMQKLQPDLVYFPNAVDGDTMAVEKAAYLAFTQMQRNLEAEGIRIALYDGYRTAKDQVYLVENGLTTTVAAAPGYSEHHTGLLLDVVVWYGGTWCSENETRSKLACFKRLHEVMPDYGFIDRYPAGKECFTEVPYIPYEARFVGTPIVAHAIADNGLCLEEFLGMQ